MKPKAYLYLWMVFGQWPQVLQHPNTIILTIPLTHFLSFTHMCNCSSCMSYVDVCCFDSEQLLRTTPSHSPSHYPFHLSFSPHKTPPALWSWHNHHCFLWNLFVIVWSFTWGKKWLFYFCINSNRILFVFHACFVLENSLVFFQKTLSVMFQLNKWRLFFVCVSFVCVLFFLCMGSKSPVQESSLNS